MAKKSSSKQRSDLIVVGSGPTGGILSLLAAQKGFDVTLIDARPKKLKPKKDGRNFAIVRGGWRLFQRAGLADKLLDGAQALNGLEAIDGATHLFGAPGALFSNEDLQGDTDDLPLGYMVQAEQLQAAIDNAIEAEPRIKLIRPDTFEQHETVPGAIRIQLGWGKMLESRLLIGCDGGRSSVRQSLGIETEERSYNRAVFAANVELSRPHDGIARQLFTPEGPFATLPLRDNRANLAWYLSEPAARALMALDRDAQEAELNHRFSEFAGVMKIVTDPISYPLTLALANTMIGPRAALVGDAARRVNPLAGQGLNLGLKDVGALIDVIEDARDVGLDIGAGPTLERYQEWRRFDGNVSALGLDAIDRIFATDAAVPKAVRSLGLMAASRFAPLRQRYAQQASADQESLPRCMQPIGSDT